MSTTDKTPIREVSFRQRTDIFEQYPEMRAAAERSLYRAATDLGFEPGVLEVRDEPATEGTAFAAPLPALTVLTLRAKS